LPRFLETNSILDDYKALTACGESQRQVDFSAWAIYIKSAYRCKASSTKLEIFIRDSKFCERRPAAA
jgi:hypothetical protein